jgi:hypothetical protein
LLEPKEHMTLFFECYCIMNFVRFGQILILLFIILAPFSGNERLLRAHMVAVPLILGHWILGVTFFPPTEVEKLATGKEEGETYFGQVVSPLYRNESFLGQALQTLVTFRDARQERMVIWVGLITLWFITLHRLGFTRRLRTPPR